MSARNTRLWPHAAGFLKIMLVAALAACGGGGGSGAMSPTVSGYGGGNGSGTGTGGSGTTAYAVTNLVSDGGTGTAHTDANLVNGWGIAFNPSGFAWVADNGTSKSTLYDGNGVVQSLVVSIPAGTTGSASPTGIVFNGTQSFKVSSGGTSAPAMFLFVGEAGTLSGWSPTVNANTAITVFDGGSAGKIYKGLAEATFAGNSYLYATDFHNNTIDVFDGNFNRVTLAGNFTDPSLPAGYAPYGIQQIGGNLYVTYAKQDAEARDEVRSAGFGLIDVFDAGGTFVKRFANGGALNAPWGMAMAPSTFGKFANALLVSNFGDGRINAFDASTGQMLGTLSTSDGMPIVIDGLWGIAFGNGINSQPVDTLFFAAGPSDETHGLFGRIDAK
jgi:uncharacterized protein (TIGR03118 family)